MHFDLTELRKNFWKAAFALLLILTCLCTLLSCASSAPNDSASSSSFDYYSVKEEASYSYEKGYDVAYDSIEITESSAEETFNGVSASETFDSSANDLSERKLIKTVNLTVETKGFDEFLEIVERRVAALGGYLSSSSVNGNSYHGNRTRWADLTVRIPADACDAFLSDVSESGNVTWRSESVDDVTMTYVDMESRIKAYETEYETLLTILEKAESLSDVIVVQDRITEVTYQLESYRSQLRKYDDLIAYCTVYLNISEVEELTVVEEPPVTVGERMARGLNRTLENLAEDAEDFAVWFVSNLPVLVIDAAVVVAIALILRKILQKYRFRRKPSSEAEKSVTLKDEEEL